MSTYSFLESRWPDVILADDMPGMCSYEVAENRLTAAKWGGVMDRAIAESLKPQARAVRLPMRSYRYGNYDWNDLEVGQGLWGCLLEGQTPASFIAFVLLDHGRPIVTKVRTGPIPFNKRPAV